MSFKLIPAIDIIDGQLVRLHQGDYNKKTTYDTSPQDMAKQYIDMGCNYIHVVDLNGAVDGDLTNLHTIQSITALPDVTVQVGGGVRSVQHVEQLLSAGVSAIIIGSLWVKDFELAASIAHQYPNKIIAGLDVHGMALATHGWTKTSDVSLHDFMTRLIEIPLHSIITTDISKDGTFEGPNIDLYKTMASLTKHEIIASGGVSDIDDVIGLKQLSLQNLGGVIVGKAIIEGRIGVDDLTKLT